MGCPPVEDRETTYRLTGSLDFFGAGTIPLEKYVSWEREGAPEQVLFLLRGPSRHAIAGTVMGLSRLFLLLMLEPQHNANASRKESE
jgi:hypothetical protein